MSIYTLTYDLRNETGRQDYQPLYDEMKRLDAHRTQYSVWLLNTSSSVVAVHDHFRQFLDKDDRLHVVRMFRDEYHYSVAMPGTNDWLKRNPPEPR
jgi:hypothetical protein